ncbi:hypothetical protein TRAPUB_6008 [Trametes pubescens]|uniref:Uncharacterized protein n=1 Tax=Trametes pubescens TaxID=154538 RepID=A0A1M2V6Z5_TRAPU|nr:hypothetical protein TRAPUB_6008 [Trametes pubescens]
MATRRSRGYTLPADTRRAIALLDSPANTAPSPPTMPEKLYSLTIKHEELSTPFLTVAAATSSLLDTIINAALRNARSARNLVISMVYADGATRTQDARSFLEEREANIVGPAGLANLPIPEFVMRGDGFNLACVLPPEDTYKTWKINIAGYPNVLSLEANHLFDDWWWAAHISTKLPLLPNKPKNVVISLAFCAPRALVPTLVMQIHLATIDLQAGAFIPRFLHYVSTVAAEEQNIDTWEVNIQRSATAEPDRAGPSTGITVTTTSGASRATLGLIQAVPAQREAASTMGNMLVVATKSTSDVSRAAATGPVQAVPAQLEAAPTMGNMLVVATKSTSDASRAAPFSDADVVPPSSALTILSRPPIPPTPAAEVIDVFTALWLEATGNTYHSFSAKGRPTKKETLEQSLAFWKKFVEWWDDQPERRPLVTKYPRKNILANKLYKELRDASFEGTSRTKPMQHADVALFAMLRFLVSYDDYVCGVQHMPDWVEDSELEFAPIRTCQEHIKAYMKNVQGKLKVAPKAVIFLDLRGVLQIIVALKADLERRAGSSDTTSSNQTINTTVRDSYKCGEPASLQGYPDFGA